MPVLEDYVKKADKKSKLKKTEFVLPQGITAHVLNESVSDFNITQVFTFIEDVVPTYFLSNIDQVLIGEFRALKEKEVGAMYEDGIIYISNEQQNSEADLVDDVVHEIAHSVEEDHSERLYSDNLIEQEFLAKRYTLWEILKAEKINIPVDIINRVDYNKQIDFVLYRHIGYELLSTLTPELFLNPYSITSLSEYMATGFEFFYLGREHIVKQLCPRLYDKLLELDSLSRSK